VTLEEDLRRRDLTINAMARDSDGKLIDPFGGEKDLRAGVLRHVSEAFAEDPVRILRVARFAARFGFHVAKETMELMQGMVRTGEADYLVPERVWQEFSKGLAEPHPERMLEVLDAAGMSRKLLPEIRQKPRNFSGSLPVRFALLAWGLDEKEVEALSERLKVPNEPRELARLAARNLQRLRTAHAAEPPELLELLKRTDALRRPERFRELLEAARLAEPRLDAAGLERARRAAEAVNAGEIASQASSAADIPRLIDDARIAAIRSAR
jgi:tRNA nucleotidyltransferase (CCA-adding enzyme)